jgi:hypothetical protein
MDEDNPVNLTTFSSRLRDNLSRYLGVLRNTPEQEKEILTFYFFEIYINFAIIRRGNYISGTKSR